MKALLNDYGKTIVFCAILLIALTASCLAQKKVDLVGEVVAYRLGDFPEMAGDGSRVLVVRVKQLSKGKENSQFVFVHVPKSLDFPIELYDDEKVGVFTLVRSKQCDMSLDEFDRRAVEANKKIVDEATARARRENPDATELIYVVPLPAFMIPLTKAVANELPGKTALRCYQVRNVSTQ